MPDSDKIVQLSSMIPEVSPEERARRLQVEVERLARMSAVEWMYYLEVGDIARKHGVEVPALRKMIEAVIHANDQKARETKVDDLREKRQVERKQVREDRLARQEAERARKEVNAPQRG